MSHIVPTRSFTALNLQMTARQQAQAGELHDTVAQFHEDISQVIKLTRGDAPSSDEHCKLFNSLIDRTLDATATASSESHRESTWLKQLRLPTNFGPFSEKPRMSVVLARTGQLKAFLEHKLKVDARPGRDSMLPLVLMAVGVILVTWLAVTLYRIMFT